MSLDGALGKIALRTRSAPRQLLQVATATPSTPAAPSATHALLAGLISSTADHRRDSAVSLANLDANGQGAPLSQRAVLAIVEEIYDSVLDLEQLRRIQPALVANSAAATAEQESGGSDVPTEGLDTSAATSLAEWCVVCSVYDRSFTDFFAFTWTGMPSTPN